MCLHRNKAEKGAASGEYVVCTDCGQTLGRVHDLKCHPPYFAAVKRGHKSFEVRLDDRDYHPGDWLRLREWTPDEQYTGAQVTKEVTYLMKGGAFGVAPDYVVMAIRHPGS
jgi:hypothetical protein